MRAWLAVVITAVGLTAGCSSSGGATAPASTTPATPQGKYLAALHGLPASLAATEEKLQAMGDSSLADDGGTVCDILRHPAEQNYSYDPLDNLIHSGEDADVAAAIVHYARQYLCPSLALTSASP